MTTLLRLHNVSTPHCRIADISLRSGEILAIFGASNSIRDAILHLATGTMRSDEGTVTVLGTDVQSVSDAAWFLLVQNVAILDFGSPLQEGASIGENLAAPYLTREPPLEEPALSEAVLWLSNTVKLRIAELATGAHKAGPALRWKARLGRAIAHRPRILFVLNAKGPGAMPRILRRAQRRAKLSIVLFTSDEALAADAADRALILNPRSGVCVENRVRGWYHRLLHFLPVSASRRRKLANAIAEYRRALTRTI
jgi:ABC-type transporter Mla maintaining outer membrane lipid asymmetry ATPase subunit MlaF